MMCLPQDQPTAPWCRCQKAEKRDWRRAVRRTGRVHACPPPARGQTLKTCASLLRKGPAGSGDSGGLDVVARGMGGGGGPWALPLPCPCPPSGRLSNPPARPVAPRSCGGPRRSPAGRRRSPGAGAHAGALAGPLRSVLGGRHGRLQPPPGSQPGAARARLWLAPGCPLRKVPGPPPRRRSRSPRPRPSCPGPGPRPGAAAGRAPWLARSSPSWWQRAASSRSCPFLWALALALLSSAERGRRSREAGLLRSGGPDPLPRPAPGPGHSRRSSRSTLMLRQPRAGLRTSRAEAAAPPQAPPPPGRSLPGNVVLPPEASWELWSGWRPDGKGGERAAGGSAPPQPPGAAWELRRTPRSPAAPQPPLGWGVLASARGLPLTSPARASPAHTRDLTWGTRRLPAGGGGGV